MKTIHVQARLKGDLSSKFEGLSKELGSNTKAIEYLICLYSTVLDDKVFPVSDNILDLVIKNADCDIGEYIEKTIKDGIAIQKIRKGI